MAMALFRSCVMSRITMGVTHQLKATCRKKRDACRELPELCPCDEEVDYRYESFLDSMDQDEKREHLLDIMLCERIANHDPQPEDPDIPYAEEFEYVSHGVYVSIPHPPIDSLDHPSPYLFRVRGAFLYSEDGTTMCTIPKHYFESILARGDPGS